MGVVYILGQNPHSEKHPISSTHTSQKKFKFSILQSSALYYFITISLINVQICSILCSTDPLFKPFLTPRFFKNPKIIPTHTAQTRIKSTSFRTQHKNLYFNKITSPIPYNKPLLNITKKPIESTSTDFFHSKICT